MPCTVETPAIVDDAALDQLVGDLASGVDAVVLGVVDGEVGAARRAVHGRVSVVDLGEGAVALQDVADGLVPVPGRCVVVVRHAAPGWEVAFTPDWDPHAPVPVAAIAASVGRTAPPVPRYEPARFDSRVFGGAMLGEGVGLVAGAAIALGASGACSPDWGAVFCYQALAVIPAGTAAAGAVIGAQRAARTSKTGAVVGSVVGVLAGTGLALAVRPTSQLEPATAVGMVPLVALMPGVGAGIGGGSRRR